MTVESVPYTAVADSPCRIRTVPPPKPHPPNWGTGNESIVLRNEWKLTRGFHCTDRVWIGKPLTASSMPRVVRMPPLRNSDPNP